jgi:hypothetical protein
LVISAGWASWLALVVGAPLVWFLGRTRRR